MGERRESAGAIKSLRNLVLSGEKISDFWGSLTFESMPFSMTNNELNQIGGIILDACITAHRELGPGLLESAYTTALMREFELRGVWAIAQVPVELIYKDWPLGKIYVMDILVENEIILEIKAVDKIEPVFMAQLITYLKLAGKKLGYLINFNVPLLKDGFHRIVYNF